MKWIKTPIQTIADAGLLKEPSVLQTYMYLLAHVVCYADRGLRPGQVSYTLAQIASETGLTVKAVRGALAKLESKGLLVQHATPKRGTIGTLPQIVNLYRVPTKQQPAGPAKTTVTEIDGVPVVGVVDIDKII